MCRGNRSTLREHGHCHFVHHKSHMTWAGIKPEPNIVVVLTRLPILNLSEYYYGAFGDTHLFATYFGRGVIRLLGPRPTFINLTEQIMIWRVSCSGLWCRIVRFTFTDVSERGVLHSSLFGPEDAKTIHRHFPKDSTVDNHSRENKIC
jgi:hypothetical protein